MYLVICMSEAPIIFRDVKPGNIMLTPWDVCISLIWHARRYQVGQKRDTDRMGSPGFCSPEQYGRMQSMERTDVMVWRDAANVAYRAGTA